MTIFVSGKLQQYLEFYGAHKSFITQWGMNHEKNVDKMRNLTFMSLGESSKEITFDTLQQHLQISADQVESFVIDGKELYILRNSQNLSFCFLNFKLLGFLFFSNSNQVHSMQD